MIMMNKCFLIAVLLITTKSVVFSQNAIVKGQLTDFNGEMVVGIMESKVDTLNVSSDGYFEYKVEAKAPLSGGKIVLPPSTVISFRISKGETISLTIDKDENGRYNVIFEGDHAELNNGLEALAAGMNFLYTSQEDAASKSFSQFEKSVDEFFDRMKSTIDKVPGDSIRNELLDQSDVIRQSTKFTYVWANRRLNKAALDSDPDFVKFAESLDFNNRKIINESSGMISLVELLDMYLYWESERDKNGVESLNEYIRLFTIIQKHITDQDVKNFASKWQFDSYIENGGDEYLDETLSAFENVNTDPETTKKFRDYVAKLKVIGPGREAPDFVLIDIDDNKCMLSDLRGKVLYIDVWATWCGPCLQELPPLAELWEKYKDNPNIEFVSISVDDSSNNWKKKLEKDKPLWKHYIIEGGFAKGPMNQLYFISGIPRFMLIDKDGKIITVNAPRPSEPTVEEVLNNCL